VRTGPGDWFALGHVEAVRAALGVEPGSAESESVGILPLHEETRDERVLRAVRLAAFGEDVGTPELSEDATRVHLGRVDACAAGWFAARLEAALWAESLDSHSVEVVPGS
jgi:coenzyme F420-0:L-glutamate ligase/coenzyme F420-1:gamma-L-glutamate ligase